MTRTRADIKNMSRQDIADYCEWCFRKDYGNCKICAINSIINKQESNISTSETGNDKVK